MMLTDTRPYLGAKIQFAKYYKRKKDDEYILSKKPIVTYEVNRNHSCRELFIDSLRSQVYASQVNNKVNSNPYRLVPEPYIEINDKKLPLNTSIQLHACGVNQMRVMSKHSDTLSKSLDYILGILSVCLARGKGEKERRNLKEGLAGDFTMEKEDRVYSSSPSYMASYNTLSPFWITSPILTSFILGVARNCLSITMGLKDKELNKLLFDNIPYAQVKKAINNTDYKLAQSIYYEVLVPFFSQKGIAEHNGIYLSSKRNRDTIKKLIDDGFDSVFKPHRMKQHWQKYSNFYGFNRMVGYINNPNSVLLWENYRRV